MKKTMEIYRNLENGRFNYTFSGGSYAAERTDLLTVLLPAGWDLCRGLRDNTMIKAPWGRVYAPSEVLTGSGLPYLMARDSASDGKKYWLQEI